MVFKSNFAIDRVRIEQLLHRLQHRSVARVARRRGIRRRQQTAAQAIGVDVDDPNGDYLLVFRQLINWPIDADGLIIGEDAYQTGPVSVTKLGVADLPQEYIDQKAAAANA